MLRVLQGLEDWVRALIALGFMAVYGLGFLWTLYVGSYIGDWQPFYVVVSTGIPQIVLTWYFTREASRAWALRKSKHS